MGSPIETLVGTPDQPEDMPTIETLAPNDYCDRCQQQARVKATGVSGVIYLCAHHFRKHEVAVRNFAFEILDETDEGFSKDK
jgi:hypothetical protein